MAERDSLLVLTDHVDGVSEIVVSPDGRCVISRSGRRDRTVRVWSWDTGACLHTLVGGEGGSGAVVVTPDSRWVISSDLDPRYPARRGAEDGVRIWELAAGQWLRTLGHNDVVSMVVTPDGRRLFTASSMSIIEWELETGKRLKNRGLFKWGVKALAVSPDGHHLFASEGNEVHMWSLETGTKIPVSILLHRREVNIGEYSTPTITSLAVSPDGHHLVLGYVSAGKGALGVFDLEAKELREFEPTQSLGTAVVVTPDGRHIISGGTPVRVWSLETGACLHTFTGHTSGVTSLAVTPDGHQLISGGWDKTIRAWDLTIL